MTPEGTQELKLGDYVSKAIDLFMDDPVNWIIIGIVGTFVIGVGTWGGFQNCALIALRGERPQVGDVLRPFSRFVDCFVPIVLIGLGFLFCVIPGLYLAGLWFLTFPLIMNRGMSWQEATQESARLLKPQLLPAILLAFVSQLIGQVLGFITAPLNGMIQVYAYRDLLGETEEG